MIKVAAQGLMLMSCKKFYFIFTANDDVVYQCCRDHCLLQITGVGSRMQEPTNRVPGSGPFQRY